MFLNVPNILTLIRLILVPIMGVCMFHEMYLASAVIFLAASITDVLDGYIARRFQLVTDFGKFFDPLADKLLSVTALFFLAFNARISEQSAFLNWIIPALVFTKELLIGIGGLIIYKNKRVIRGASWYGKGATVFFFIAILLLMFDKTLRLGRAAIVIAFVCSVFALIMYARVYFTIQISSDIEKKGNGK